MTYVDERQKTVARDLTVRVHQSGSLESQIPRLADYVLKNNPGSLCRHPGWLMVLAKAMRHTPFCLEALRGNETCGVLPLAYVHSMLFGRFLVSLPYLNCGGVQAEDTQAAKVLIDHGVELAKSLDVRFLELRHEQPVHHANLPDCSKAKVQMRLSLPTSCEEFWGKLGSKVRNQVRKAQKGGLVVDWGGGELVSDFFGVFSRNMRDLGTPTYAKRLFHCILAQFPGQSEICVVRAGRKPIAGALLLHGWGVADVPSASSLRAYNPTCANMLLYWQLLERAIQRGQAVFDFGRSGPGSSTYRFKEQWGATASPSHWQYFVRRGSVGDMRPDNARYQTLIRLWRRLPLMVTRLLGPRIVRGIP